MCELNSKVKIFCATTNNAIQATNPSPRNGRKCNQRLTMRIVNNLAGSAIGIARRYFLE